MTVGISRNGIHCALRFGGRPLIVFLRRWKNFVLTIALALMLLADLLTPPLVGASQTADVMNGSRTRHQNDVSPQGGRFYRATKGEIDTGSYDREGEGPKASRTQKRRNTCPASDNLKDVFLSMVNESIIQHAPECLHCDQSVSGGGRKHTNDEDINMASLICDKASSANHRTRTMRNLSLRFCDNYPVTHAIDQCTGPCTDIESKNASTCRECLDPLVELDKQAEEMYSHFHDIISQYDCTDKYMYNYSSTCAHCRMAYKYWLCSQLIPYYGVDMHLIPPCQDYCRQVEKTCPYLLPALKSQYMGQPSFLCTVQEIPRQEVNKLLHETSTTCYYQCADASLPGICIRPTSTVHGDSNDATSVGQQFNQKTSTGPGASDSNQNTQKASERDKTSSKHNQSYVKIGGKQRHGRKGDDDENTGASDTHRDINKLSNKQKDTPPMSSDGKSYKADSMYYKDKYHESTDKHPVPLPSDESVLTTDSSSSISTIIHLPSYSYISLIIGSVLAQVVLTFTAAAHS